MHGKDSHALINALPAPSTYKFARDIVQESLPGSVALCLVASFLEPVRSS